MAFEDYLLKENIIDELACKQIKNTENTFLEITNRLSEDIYFEHMLSFYKLREVKNTDNLAIDFDNSSKVDDFYVLVAKDLICLKTNYSSNVWLILNPDNFKEIDKIRQNTINPIFAVARKVEFQAIYNRVVKPAEVACRAEEISKTTENKVMNVDYTSQAKALYKSLLDAAIENRASDMHIIPMSNKVKIAFRIDGKIENYCYIPLNILNNLKNVISNEGQLPSNSIAIPQEGIIKYEYKGQFTNVRINIIPTLDTFDINLRFLSSNTKSINEIGFLKDEQETLLKVVEQTKGLIIMTGPTGSGKSTTLYAALSGILGTGRKIMSLEDPVEINVDGFTQVTIRTEFAFGFPEGVATAMRHDSDVIYIGECKDVIVAKETIKMADTGHLALTTLHTNDSFGAISRLRNLEIPEYAIGDVLTVVIAQRLVRRVCDKCFETYSLEKKHKWRELFNLGDEEIILARGKGCSYCDGRGYKDRLAIVEFLLVNNEIREGIQTGANRAKLYKSARQNGFETLLENGIKKALLHLTTLDELVPYARDLL
ncbi:MAG: ATPase, T2SS/T4P/T4SS family [Clostridia bacterium]